MLEHGVNDGGGGVGDGVEVCNVGWGAALLVWTIGVGTMDNILRPFLIRKGADLPMLLIFAGVIGGLSAFGIVGLFVGPVVLAVTYTLLKDWVASET
jgi:predicted PurR-regulated permease PerM